MDCKVFRKRLDDLIENNISYDLKDSMLEHIEQCEACKIAYEEEKFIEENFKVAFIDEGIEFRSIRADVMKSIDRNRYSNSPIKKLYYHLKKYKATYSCMAAALAGLMFMTPYVMKNGFSFGSAKLAEQKSESLAMPRAQEGIAAEKKSMDAENSLTADNSIMMAKEMPYMPVFGKKDADKNSKQSFNTPWQDSKNKIFSATVEGKGKEGQDEGIAKIVVREIKTNSKWTFELLENEQKQFTPKVLRWIDDENMLVIVGYGYGTVDIGGQLYVLNINDASVRAADPDNKLNLDKYSQVTKIISLKELPSGEKEVTVEVLIYKDDLFNESRTETRSIVIQ